MSFINNIKKDNNIILHKIGNPAPEVLISSSKTTKVAFLDTETTGLNPHDDIIIELAIKIVEIENDSGKIVSIGQDYTSFNDPKVPIKKEISLLTGISDDMVAGKNIDWREVDLLIENSELIVAHNASFDRSFIDKNSTKSSHKIWACSVNDIDWLKRGFTSTKQELLCYWHGFYFDAHRAMDDVNALIHLLTHNYQDNFRPIVELVKNSGVPIYMIRATNFSYNEIKKNRVKNQGYKWNVNDKIWCKIVNYETLEQEKELLADIIYENSFDGEVIEIEPFNKYKN
tara:strand:+ start:570 stop:1427 length:858 start_codon:yes stop_codon:yes gene_type:complete